MNFKNPKLKIIKNVEILEIKGEKFVEGIMLKDKNTNEEKELELKRKEAEINAKMKELEALKIKEPQTKEVQIKDEQIGLLLNKLESVKSTIINKYKDNKVCGIYDKIPTIPNDAFSINFEKIDIDKDLRKII